MTRFSFRLRRPLANLALIGLLAGGGPSAIRAALPDANEAAARSAFRLASDQLTDGGRLPENQVLNGFGRHGGNLSPHLRWIHAPAGTKSFVLTLYDPDAPTGSGWWHWVVIDLPATTSELPQGASRQMSKMPAGAREMRTDFGSPGYGGAAPPAGETHRYVFTLHALDVAHLDAPDESSAAMIGFLVHAHSLGSATLTVLYGP